MGGEDGLQHEVHHQSPERRFVQLIKVDGPHRAPLRHERVGDGALLRRHKVARGMAGEIVGVGRGQVAGEVEGFLGIGVPPANTSSPSGT